MTEQITLQQALELVDFHHHPDAGWRVRTVKGNCITVEGYCITVEGFCGTVKGACSTVEGDCVTVKGDCITVEGNCHTVKGNCGAVEGSVYGTINGRQWRYVETPKERMTHLIEQGASKEELLKALEQL
jgi:hypothetical protein